MGFQGFSLNHTDSVPQKQQVGFSGFRIFLEGIPVYVTDGRERPLAGVRLFAANTTSDNPFTSETGANGSSFMELDNDTTIVATRDKLKKTVQYDGSGKFIIILESNLFPA